MFPEHRKQSEAANIFSGKTVQGNSNESDKKRTGPIFSSFLISAKQFLNSAKSN
jgi:hypothetical protein